jgi:hypothetical protein
VRWRGARAPSPVAQIFFRNPLPYLLARPHIDVLVSGDCQVRMAAAAWSTCCKRSHSSLEQPGRWFRADACHAPPRPA